MWNTVAIKSCGHVDERAHPIVQVECNMTNQVACSVQWEMTLREKAMADRVKGVLFFTER